MRKGVMAGVAAGAASAVASRATSARARAAKRDQGRDTVLVMIESEQRVVARLTPGRVLEIATGERVIFAVFPPKFLG